MKRVVAIAVCLKVSAVLAYEVPSIAPKPLKQTQNPAQVQAHGVTSPEGLVDFYLALLVDGDVTPEARQALVDYLNASGPLALDDSGALDLKARGLVHLALATPSYQLA